MALSKASKAVFAKKKGAFGKASFSSSPIKRLAKGKAESPRQEAMEKKEGCE